MNTGYHGTHRRETHMQRYEIFKATDRKVVKTVPFFWLAKLLIRFIPRYRHMDFELEGGVHIGITFGLTLGTLKLLNIRSNGSIKTVDLTGLEYYNLSFVTQSA